jgi:hypothetical protein
MATTKTDSMITNILSEIKEQIGLDLNLCDYFTGVIDTNRGKYFNVILNERTSDSQDYVKLERYSEKFKTISVEPNGLKRVAIFFK